MIVHHLWRRPWGVIRLIEGDITKAQTAAIVNAANRALQHGGGVAGTIARAGGPGIQAESDEWIKRHGPITHAAPALTSGGALPCRFVIHAVGPIWGEGDEVAKLHQAVTGALALAAKHGCVSVALPAISTGIYGFPIREAAVTIAQAVQSYCDQHAPPPGQIDITLFDAASATVFAEAIDRLQGGQ